MTKTISNINSIFLLQNRYQLKFMFHSIFNTNTTQKNIIARNIFNVTGEIPKEDSEFARTENDNKIFAQIPCSPASETLPVDVLGIIYTGNPKTNLVTVQDPDVEGADVYHEGDTILDYSSYSVYRIPTSSSVEFRYGNKKICRSLVSTLPNVVQKSDDIGNTSEDTTDESSDENTDTVILTREEIAQETSGGLAKFVNAMRTAPSLSEGKLEGFKVFAIAPGSVFEKIGLKNGDIVTEINNQILDNPTKGILIYQIFQYENQITFTVKRGTERVTRKVVIK